MKDNFIQFIDDLAKVSSQFALCEAVKQGYKICCESRFWCDPGDPVVLAKLNKIENANRYNPHKFDYKEWFRLSNLYEKVPMKIAKLRCIDATRIYKNVVERILDKFGYDPEIESAVGIAARIYEQVLICGSPISKKDEDTIMRGFRNTFSNDDIVGPNVDNEGMEGIENNDNDDLDIGDIDGLNGDDEVMETI